MKDKASWSLRTRFFPQKDVFGKEQIRVLFFTLVGYTDPGS